MSDLEQENNLKRLVALDEQVTELYQAVEEFLNNFGKENALYPTRTFIQVNSAELQKLAKIYYRHIS